MTLMNKMGALQNSYQRADVHKRVLTVCSAGCLRSPTAAVVLAGEPYNFNTRAAGCVEEYAIIPVTEELVFWADEIVFMEASHKNAVGDRFSLSGQQFCVLDIPDRFAYRDPELMKLIRDRYNLACRHKL